MIRILRKTKRLLRRPEHSLLFAFPGGSGAWPGMGRELYRTQPVFRKAVEDAGAVVKEMLGWDAAARFRGVDEPELPLKIARRNEIVHLGLLQIGQVDLWRASGVRPHGVVSVSLGEMVAPYAAGALSREDTTRVLAAIAHAVSQETSERMMFLVSRSSEEARRLAPLAPAPLDYLGSALPDSAVLLSAAEDAAAIRTFLGASILREIATDWNYHTPRLPLDHAWLREQLRDVKTLPAFCPIYSAAAGGRMPDGAPLDAQFFGWMASRPFHYVAAVEAALRDGFDTVVTVGPQPMSNAWIEPLARARGRHLHFIGSTRVEEEARAWREASRALRWARIRPPRRKPIVAETVVLGEADPFETYEELRRDGPVQWLPRYGYWLILGYDEVRRALNDAARFSSELHALTKIDPVLLGNDSQSHANAQRILSRYFSGEEVARRSELAERTAEKLLRPLAEGRDFEVVTELAHPLVAAVAADLVGVGVDEMHRLDVAMAEAAGNLEKSYALMAEGMGNGRVRMIEELRAAGFDDDAARSLTRLIWIAALTPQHAIGTAVLLLLQHDDMRRSLQNDPSLLGAFVDESLRLQPPSFVIPRTAAADVEIGGRTIRAGDRVELALAAANRDPAKFPDPATPRLDRGANPHLSFGGGLHICLGAALGRGLMAATLRALFRLAPDFHAVQPLATVRRSQGTTLYELEQLVISA